MKKFLILVLALVFSISLFACFGDSKESGSDSVGEPTSQKESVVEPDSEEQSQSEEESQSEEQSQSEEESQSEQQSDSESEDVSEPVIEVYTITFEVNVNGVAAPEQMQVQDGEVITLPTVDCQYQFKCWVIKGTDTVFEGGEFTYGDDVVLVAVFYAETGNY